MSKLRFATTSLFLASAFIATLGSTSTSYSQERRPTKNEVDDRLLGQPADEKTKLVVEFKWLESQHTPNKTSPKAIRIGEADFYAQLKPFWIRSDIKGVVRRVKNLADNRLGHFVEFFPDRDSYIRLDRILRKQLTGRLGVFVNGNYTNSHLLNKRSFVYGPLLSGFETKDWVQKVAKSFEGEAAISRAVDSNSTPVEVKGHTDVISDFVVTKNPKQMYTTSKDKSVRVWNLSSGIPVNKAILGSHDGKVSSVAASSDGRRIVTGGYDRSVHIWISGEKELDLKINKGLSINAVSISPNGRWVLAGNIQMTAVLWDMNAKNPENSARLLEERKTFHGNWEGDTRLPWIDTSQDGRWGVTGSGDGVATLWDLSSKDPSANPIVLSGHDDTMINRVAFSPDSRWVATGGWTESVRLWRLNMTPDSSSFVLPVNGRLLNSLAFSPDGRWLALCNQYSIRLWTLRSNKPESKFLELFGHSKNISACAFSPSGRWFAATSDKKIRIWDLRSSPPASSALVLNLKKYASTLLFTSDDLLVAGMNNGDLKVWNLSNSSDLLEVSKEKKESDNQ